MTPIPNHETDSRLAVAIDMDELVDNETKEDKWCDIWLMTSESMIYLPEDLFGDDVPWDCKAMLAYDYEVSLISSSNDLLTTSSIKGRGLRCKIEPCKLSKSLHKTIRIWTKHYDSLRVIYGAKTRNSACSIKANWFHRVVMTE